MEESQLTAALARIRAPDNGAVAGAGFLVAPRLVLTCAHVVDGALRRRSVPEPPREPVRVDFPAHPDAAPLAATVIADGWVQIDDAGRGDVAVLGLQADPPQGMAPPPLLRPPSVMDHRFRVEGFPAGLEDAWATGVMRGATGPGRQWVQLEDVKVAGPRVERGFSGAPVWDDELGAVVGIVVAALGLVEAKVAEMIPTAVLCRLWPELERSIGWRLRADPARRRHWLPRARGVRRLRRDDSRWLFSGREAVMNRLATWLAATDGAAPAFVVTGGPGSGKSSVLAWLVTLADADERAKAPAHVLEGPLPPVGCVDVAVHASAKTLTEVVAEIARATDVRAASADALIDELIEAERSRVIVVDALDEAAGGEAQRIATELLAPLAADAPGIRLLVATRRGPEGLLLRRLGSSMTELDLDDPAWSTEDDIAAYVTRLLTEADAYREHPDRSERIARAVARRASPSFLVAQLVGLSLQAAEPPDIGAADWEQRLPDTVGDAMETYLARLGSDGQRARDLLRPLAYAEGSGLPTRTGVWPALASAIAGLPYSEADVVWLLRSAAADYVVEHGQADGDGEHHALFHRALADHLRAGESVETVQRRCTTALIGVVRTAEPAGAASRWDTSPRYVRRHLAAHAAAAGRLDALLEDGEFLTAADPDRLLVALSTSRSPGAERVARLYRLVADRLQAGSTADRAALLELAARQVGDDAFADHIVPHGAGRTWSVPWARCAPPSAHQVCLRFHRHAGMAGVRSRVSAIAVAQLADGGIVAARRGDGTLHIWDLGRSAPRPAPALAAPLSASLAALVIDGRPLLVFADPGGLRLWDLAADAFAAPRCELARDVAVHALAALEQDGRPIALAACSDGTLRSWDLERGAARGEPLVTGPVASERWRSALWTVARWRQPVTTTGRSSCGTSSAVTQSTSRRCDSGRWSAPSCSTRAGASSPGIRTARCAAGTSGSGAATGPPIIAHSGGAVAALAMIDLDARRVAVSGGADGTVGLWDVAEWRAAAPPRVGHEGSVGAVGAAHVGGRALALSGSSDGTLRAWDLSGIGDEHEAPPIRCWRGSSAPARRAGMAVSRSPPALGSGAIELRDALDGSLLDPPLRQGSNIARGRPSPLPVVGATVRRAAGVRGRRARRRPTVAAQRHGIPSARARPTHPPDDPLIAARRRRTHDPARSRRRAQDLGSRPAHCGWSSACVPIRVAGRRCGRVRGQWPRPCGGRRGRARAWDLSAGTTEPRSIGDGTDTLALRSARSRGGRGRRGRR